MSKLFTTIKIDLDLHDWLTTQAHKDESYNDVLRRLLKFQVKEGV